MSQNVSIVPKLLQLCSRVQYAAPIRRSVMTPKNDDSANAIVLAAS